MNGNGEAEQFYRSLPVPCLVGLESCGNSQWFLELVEGLGHEVWVGDAAQIRVSYVRKQKTDRRDAIQPAFDALLGVVDEVLPVTHAAVQRAKEIVLGYRRLSARDAVHVSVMEQHDIAQILSFDAGFDSFPGISRIS